MLVLSTSNMVMSASPLWCVVSTHKLTFEEFITILTQVESCLNSRPLVPLQCDEDGIEALTPGHFLIGKPPEATPDLAFSYRTLSTTALVLMSSSCSPLLAEMVQRIHLLTQTLHQMAPSH